MLADLEGVIITGDLYKRMAAIKGDANGNKWTLPNKRTVRLSVADSKMLKEKVDARWAMLHTDLLSAAYVLNPFYHDEHSFDGDVMLEFNSYLDSLVPVIITAEEREAAKAEMDMFREKEGYFADAKVWKDLEMCKVIELRDANGDVCVCVCMQPCMHHMIMSCM